jgi:Protein of unknown function (DUF1376)
MTEPLTPADCDLRGLPFMPLDVIRLCDSDLTAISTGDEFKAAVLLWAKSWLQVPAASLPDDDRVLAHLSGTGAKWRKIKPVAMRGFILCSDGRWYHPIVAEKALEAMKHRDRFREKREQDRERLSDWRDKKRSSKQSQTQGETPVKRVSDGDGNGPEAGLKRLRQGEGEGHIPLSNDNGAEPDSDKRFWDGAKGYLGAKNASLIGKWVRDHGKEETASAITAAQLNRAVNPVEFVHGRLRSGAGNAQPVVPL